MLWNTGLRQEAKEKAKILHESNINGSNGIRDIDTSPGYADASAHLAVIACSLSAEQHTQCTFAPPTVHELMHEFEGRAMKNFTENSPKADQLINLSRMNILRAAYDNVLALGMSAEWMCRDDAVSILSRAGPALSHHAIPLSLRATSLQQQVPHHPWLDAFPFPRMRDNLILAGDSLDDDELCHDLTAFWDTRRSDATLLVWGTPWDPRNWEVTEGFAKKWGWVLRGSPEILVSTNKWRVKRGERVLHWRQVLC
jgi:hypothetical protein